MYERNGIGGEVRHGVTSGVSCETSLNKHVTPHLHREYCLWSSTEHRAGRAFGTGKSREPRRVTLTPTLGYKQLAVGAGTDLWT